MADTSTLQTIESQQYGKYINLFILHHLKNTGYNIVPSTKQWEECYQDTGEEV